jgi:hypothetical protein
MGATGSKDAPRLVGFSAIEAGVLKRDHVGDCLLITTMPQPLIQGTVPPEVEENAVNDLLRNGARDMSLIVYGQHGADASVFKKYYQLVNLGFTNVAIYMGGAFEWALLRDIYGATAFPTMAPCTDPLAFAAAL